MALGSTQPLTGNEYQEHFIGVKATDAYGWQPYHLHVPIVLKSGSLNLLEPLEPVQACNGIALPLHYTLLPYPEEGNNFSHSQAVKEEQLDCLIVKVEGNIVFKTSVIVHETSVIVHATTRCNISEELNHE
jgi:hypothetical protein